ncbi:hypothetical protein [Nocardia cyriacigeorgica]|nr:hypothetical protein [Nocardia cyriacigeorgica]
MLVNSGFIHDSDPGRQPACPQPTTAVDGRLVARALGVYKVG